MFKSFMLIYQIEVVESESGVLGDPTVDSGKFNVASCDLAFKEATQDITKAISCLQNALAGNVGNEGEVGKKLACLGIFV